LESAGNRSPEPAVLFYVTDDDRAGQEVERLIRTAGFEPVKAGGLEQSGQQLLPHPVSPPLGLADAPVEHPGFHAHLVLCDAASPGGSAVMRLPGWEPGPAFV
jgi:hypothetical protein